MTKVASRYLSDDAVMVLSDPLPGEGDIGEVRYNVLNGRIYRKDAVNTWVLKRETHKFQAITNNDVGLIVRGRAGVSTPVSPDDMTGVTRRWRAADLALTNGAAIGSWTSPVNSKVLSQSVALRKPTYVTASPYLNNKPAVRFTAATQGLYGDSSAVGSLTQGTVVVVFSAQGDGSYMVLNTINGPGGQGWFRFGDGNSYMAVLRNPRNEAGHDLDLPAVGESIVIVRSSTTEYTVNVNGLGSTFTPAEIYSPGTGFALGAEQDGSGYGFIGDVAEIICFDHFLDDTETANLSAWLSIEYDIDLLTNGQVANLQEYLSPGGDILSKFNAAGYFDGRALKFRMGEEAARQYDAEPTVILESQTLDLTEKWIGLISNDGSDKYEAWMGIYNNIAEFGAYSRADLRIVAQGQPIVSHVVDGNTEFRGQNSAAIFRSYADGSWSIGDQDGNYSGRHISYGTNNGSADPNDIVYWGPLNLRGHPIKEMAQSYEPDSPTTLDFTSIPVRAATAADEYQGIAMNLPSSDRQIPVGSASPLVIDGVTLADGDYVLLKNRLDPKENGVYRHRLFFSTYDFVWAGQFGPYKRAGMPIAAAEGDVNGGKVFYWKYKKNLADTPSTVLLAEYNGVFDEFGSKLTQLEVQGNLAVGAALADMPDGAEVWIGAQDGMVFESFGAGNWASKIVAATADFLRFDNTNDKNHDGSESTTRFMNDGSIQIGQVGLSQPLDKRIQLGGQVEHLGFIASADNGVDPVVETTMASYAGPGIKGGWVGTVSDHYFAIAVNYLNKISVLTSSEVQIYGDGSGDTQPRTAANAALSLFGDSTQSKAYLRVLDEGDNPILTLQANNLNVLDLHNHKIVNLATPVDGTDAVTKDYVDGLSTTIARNKYNRTLDASDISNQYFDLPHEAHADALFVIIDGLIQEEGTDYTASVEGGVTRITFAGDLATGGDTPLIVGDRVNTQYTY